MTLTATPAVSAGLDSRCLLVDLDVHQWSGKATDASASDELASAKGADRKAGSYRKGLVFSAAFGAVKKAFAGLSTLLDRHSLPWASGVRIMRTHQYDQVRRAMESAIREACARADAYFDAQYAADIATAQNTMLGGLFRRDDYPTAQDARALFSASLRFLPVPVAGDFRAEMEQEHVDAIRAEIAEHAEAAARAAQRELLARIYAPIAKMATQLAERYTTDGERHEAGEYVVFRDSLVHNVQDACHAARIGTLHDDPQLDALLTAIETSIGSYTPEQVRVPVIRAEVGAEADRLAKAVAEAMRSL